MSEVQIESLRQWAAAKRKEAEAAEQLEQLVRDNPGLIDSLAGMFGGGTTVRPNGSLPAKPRPKTHGGGPVAAENYQKVVSYLRTHGPSEIKVIAAGAKLSRNAVVQCLYKTHRAAFEKEAVPGNNLRKRFKVKEGKAEQNVAQ